MKVIFTIVGALAYLIVAAHAASPQYGDLVGPNPPLLSSYSTKSCLGSTLTSPKFLELVKAIIEHGNLTDVSFAENIFQVHFKQSYYGLSPDGELDRTKVFYQSTRILNSPITASLWVDTSKIQQLTEDRIGLMSIDSQSLPDLDADYLRDCLRIPISSFYSVFGGGFLGGVINGRGAATKEIDFDNKIRSRIFVNVGYSPKDKLVNHIGIDQQLFLK